MSYQNLDAPNETLEKSLQRFWGPIFSTVGVLGIIVAVKAPSGECTNLYNFLLGILSLRCHIIHIS